MYCDSKSRCFSQNNCRTKVTPPIVIDFRWSLTLSFSDDTGNLKYDDLVHGQLRIKCGKNQYYDIKQGRCIDIYCPKKYVVTGLDCVLKQPTSNGVLSNVKNIKPTDQSYFLYIQVRNETFLDNETYRLFYATQNSTIFRSIKPVNFPSLDTQIIKLRPQLQYHQAGLFIGMHVDKSLITSDYGLDFSRFFKGNRLCATPILIPHEMIKAANSTTVTYQNKTFAAAELSHWISFQGMKEIHHYSACLQFHLTKPCLRQILPSMEIRKSKDMSITHYVTGMSTVYKANQYLPTDIGYYICLNKTNLLRKMAIDIDDEIKALLDAEHYITLVGISISILCYLWIILAYAVFKESHSVAGLSNCFMCCSLLIADISILSSMKAGKNSVACFIVSVVIHWSLLASFTWTMVIAFDLVSRFGSLRIPAKENVLKKMVYRSLVAFCVPAIVVFAAAVLDKSKTINIGYGESQICWRLSNHYSRIVLYIIPTALMTAIALCSLCFTIRKIFKEKHSTGKYLDSKENTKATMIKMTIKLCVILGLTEIFGYIQIPDPQNKGEYKFNLAFGFIYAVLRSFRGVMLWCVYIYGQSSKSAIKDTFKNSVSNFSRKGSTKSTASTTRIPLTKSPDINNSLRSTNL